MKSDSVGLDDFRGTDCIDLGMYVFCNDRGMYHYRKRMNGDSPYLFTEGTGWSTF